MRRLKKLVTKRRIAISAGLLLGGGAIYTIEAIRNTYQRGVSSKQAILDNSQKKYAYPVDPDEKASFLKRHLSRIWLPVSGLIARPMTWQLFEEIQNSIDEINDDAIIKFAKLSSLLESECNHFSICMDLKTAIALARCGADPRLFISPLIISKDNKDYYGNKFRHIFNNMSRKHIHSTLDTLIKGAFKLYHPTDEEREDRSLDYYTGFESDFHLSQNPAKTMGEKDFLKICLQGVVSHSRMYSNIDDLISYEVLDLLVVISKEYNENTEIMSLVLKVLANLSCSQSSAQPIKDTGCLKILAEYSRSPLVKLALPAKRALHNLDRRGTSPILPSGMYQLYPEYDCDECSYDFDVVFIHGLLGGVFRTWRRQDSDPARLKSDSEKAERETLVSIWKSRIRDLRSRAPLLYNPTTVKNPDETVKYPSRKLGKDGEIRIEYEDVPLELEEIESTPTQCWPRDWLPMDCPRARVIGVDFESFVTQWMNICPIETTERRLEDRSAEILKKLQLVGIGKRPVIFVTHSLGGLLLKSLLCQAESSEDYRNICANTKGVVFCSVPHLGTDMAVLNTARRWLLMPTQEIDELANADQQLTRLNDCFLGLFNQYKFKVLSFAEILETKTGLGMKFKLVPFSSADIGVGEFYPLRLDHLGTCKPWSRGSFLYSKTIDLIKSVSSSTKSNHSIPNISVVPKEGNVETVPVVTAFRYYFWQPFTNGVDWISKTLFWPKKFAGQTKNNPNERDNNNSDKPSQNKIESQ